MGEGVHVLLLSPVEHGFEFRNFDFCRSGYCKSLLGNKLQRRQPCLRFAAGAERGNSCGKF